MAVAEAARGQTTINQKAAAITADTVVVVETAAAVAVAAAMAATQCLRQQWRQASAMAAVRAALTVAEGVVRRVAKNIHCFVLQNTLPSVLHNT